MARRPSSPASYNTALPSSPRGRGSSPRPPPSYARSSLDRSPSLNPLVLDERPRVPPPIYLRSSSPQPASGKGTLKIHVPAWGVALVRPPRVLELHPLESGSVEREPPCEDTVLSGALEVIMKERRKVQAISVGVQSVCKLHMGQRGWEEDGIFERGVEVLSGNEDGIWLEKGSQSFGFTILLPATLATTDGHAFGRLSYILTARIEGIPASTSFSAFFKSTATTAMLDPEIPRVEDFEAVIARSDRVAAGLNNRSRSGSMTSPMARAATSRESLLQLRDMSLEDASDEASAIAVGEGSPSIVGLYTRRQSSDVAPSQHPPPLSPQSLDENERPLGLSSPPLSTQKTEKAGWMKGDLCASRELVVHANPSRTGGVTQLDLRKEGFVDGLGSWRFSASADTFSISSVILISITVPTPSPHTTIFLARLVLAQSYTITSPRTPNLPPSTPEAPKHHVLYQVGRAHKQGERFPMRDVDSLWRGCDAGGAGDAAEGWRIKAVARMPNHDKIRPTTGEGTITPIRVSHELIFQVFYSLDGESVRGEKIDGPGELRMMSVKMPICVPSCCCTANALHLPTYETAHCSPADNIDAILASPPTKHRCMCGSTFAELGEAAMKRMQMAEQEDLEERMREHAGPAEGVKESEVREEQTRGEGGGGDV
ncbi:hypothetical protein IAT38_004036 [Cryptococcus sp. DSM 104549]